MNAIQNHLIMRNLESPVTEKSKRLKQQRIPEFEKIFHLFHPALCFFARKWVNDMSIAQDIVTEVFLKLWQKQADFDTLYSVKAFLYISTRNACINHNQQAQYQSRVKANIRQFSNEVESDGVNEIIHAEVLQEVYSIVKELPTKCREVMMLSYSEGMDCHEIARKMSVSVNTVRNQKTRGVHLIRNRFRSANYEAEIF
jgi:RNA polymerase sigma-70 factor (family 1)